MMDTAYRGILLDVSCTGSPVRREKSTLTDEGVAEFHEQQMNNSVLRCLFWIVQRPQENDSHLADNGNII